jgi:hypothetical protein
MRIMEYMTHEEAVDLCAEMKDFFFESEVVLSVNDITADLVQFPGSRSYSYVSVAYHGMCVSAVDGPEHFKAWLEVIAIAAKSLPMQHMGRKS